MRLILFFLLSCCWLLAGGAAHAQVFSPRGAMPPDSLHAAEGSFEVPSDSLGRRFDEARLRLSLERYARRKTLAGRAVAGFFRLTKPQQEERGLDAVLLNRQFDQHNFKVVRRITILPLDAFGYSLNDSLRRPRSLVERGGNTLHIRTARSRIRQVLLFRVGQPLLPQALAESERLLRQTDEILDARVLVDERTATRDSVDILVRTTDIFSITGEADVRTANQGVLKAGDVNFLGLGHQFEHRYQYGRGLPQDWGYEGNYRMPFRHFFYANAYYHNEFETHSGGASLVRDFYSPTARWAGAASFNALNLRVILGPPDALQYAFRTVNTYNLWVGRALRLRSYDLGYENPGRLVVAASAGHEQHLTAFSDSPDERTKTLYLGAVGYSVRRYYKDKYLFGFGRTEDVPTGTLLALVGGYEANPVSARTYLDARVSTAFYHERHGYFYAGVDLGSYRRVEDGGWEQGLLSAQTLYFSRRYRVGTYQYRHFLTTRVSAGFHRYPGEILYSGITTGQGGLRGFSPSPTLGQVTSRFLANYEANVYTPLSLAGFRVALLAFADVAVVNTTPGGGSPFGSDPLLGVGLGMRFRNELTALRTFQVLLGYYPRGQVAPNGVRLFDTSRESFQFADFSFSQPGVTQYGGQ